MDQSTPKRNSSTVPDDDSPTTPQGNLRTPNVSDNTIDGNDDLMNSISSEESFEKQFWSIKNENIKKCISFLVNKIDNLTDRNNFQIRNNNIIISRLNNLENENAKLKEDIKGLKEEYDEISESLYNIECDVLKNSQYSRRESLIITGIPNSVTQRDLEATALRIIHSLGFKNISSYEVTACHRLIDRRNDKKYPQKTIIRFTNRKAVEYCLRNRKNYHLIKQMTNLNVRFYENLCDKNDFIYRECKRLKKQKQLTECYIRNGFVKIIVKEGDNPIKINHPDDLYDVFWDYYNDKPCTVK